jgi:hypothetical protein
MLLIGKLSFGLAVFACAAHESGLGDVVVASPSFLDGDTSAVYPFLIQQARLSSMRYQQVYCASDFSRISPHGGWIRWIELVPVGSLGGASICSSILISLSTTPKSQDNLSTTFLENVGPDEMTVFGPAPLSVDAPPGSFGRISFTGQFFFNPTLGNLLMDIRVEAGSPPIMGDYRWDANNQLTDTVSRVYAESNTATIASVADSTGLITLFQITPVPSLTAVIKTNSIVITWPANPDAFVLERADALLPQTTWQPITGGYVYDELRTTKIYTIPLDSAGTSGYFRLTTSPP